MLTKSKQLLTSKLFKNTSLYFTITFIGKIIPFALVPFMTKYLAPDQYGIAATYQMYIVLFLLIIGFELNRYLDVYYFKVSSEEFQKYLSTIFSIVLLIGIVVQFINLILMQFIDIEGIDTMWMLFIPIFVLFKFLSVINSSLLRNEENPILYGKYTVSETLIYTLLSLLLAWMYHEWTSRASGLITSMVILGIFSYYRLKNRYNLRVYIDKTIVKKAFIYSTPFVFGLNLANIIFANSDKIILKYFYDYSVVGVFAVALVFSAIVGFVTDSFMKAWVPVFYRKLQNNDKDVDRYSFYIFIGLGIVSAVTIVVLTYIMPYMIDEKYHNAIDIMPYIAVGYILRVGEQLLLYYINFYEKTNVLYGVVILTILSSIICAYFLVKSFGVIGMAISINLFFIFKIIYYFGIVKKIRREQ